MRTIATLIYRFADYWRIPLGPARAWLVGRMLGVEPRRVEVLVKALEAI